MDQKEIKKNLDENLYNIICKENSYLRQIYESLSSTVRIQQTNVIIKLSLSFLFLVE